MNPLPKENSSIGPPPELHPSHWRIRRSFGSRLRVFGTLLVVISVGLCAAVAYYSRKVSLEKAAGKELLAIVNSTAAAIDGDQHERVHRNGRGEIEPWRDFQALQSLLLEVKSRNALSGHGSPVYTLRKSEDFNRLKELEFVIMTDRDPDGDFSVGSRYLAPPHLHEVLNGRPTVTSIYRDEEGLWLSAAAPIRNHAGQVVAVVQADRPVNYFNQEAKRSAFGILSTAAVSVVIAWLLTWGYARSLIRPVADLARATTEVAGGNLRTRVKPAGDDELGALARGFNDMTEKLLAAQERDARQREAMAASQAATEKAHLQLEAMYQELERSYDELCRLASEAQAASQAKGEFLSVMSHELRTPLNGVIGLASLLEQSGLDADSTDSARTIRRSGEGLLEIIENVLFYTELDRGTLGIVDSPYRPVELAQEAIARVAEDAGSKGVAVRLHVAEGSDVLLRGDVVRTQKILACLLGNAVKFTLTGSVEITLRLERDAPPVSRLHLRIKDTGIGISPEDSARLFQPFVQADGSTTRRFGGIGIGLVLTKRLIESVSGHLAYFANPDGPGTTFEIELPVIAADQSGCGLAA